MSNLVLECQGAHLSQPASRTAPDGHRVDGASLACLGQALTEARRDGDQRPPLAIIASCLDELGVDLPRTAVNGIDLRSTRDEWLRRLESSRRSKSTVCAYRTALDDLLAWLEARGDRSALREGTVVAYLDDYQRRRSPAPATYYRRFVLLRRFFRWHSSRSGTPDPFLELDAPAKPQ